MRFELGNTQELKVSASASPTSLLPVIGRGRDGSNVLPTDEAMANAIDDEAVGPLTRAALRADFVGAAVLAGASFDATGATDARAAIQAKINAAITLGVPVMVPDGAVLKVVGKLTVAGPLRIGGSGTLRQYSPAASTATNKALTSNVATITTSTAHGLAVGDTAEVSISDATFDGSVILTAVPSSTTFSYAVTHANVASASASGSVTTIQPIFDVTGNDVVIEDVTLLGRRYGLSNTFKLSEDAIRVRGANASTPVTGFRQRNVTFNGFGQYGTYLNYVQDFGISGSTYLGIGNAAVLSESAWDGFVSGNYFATNPNLGSALSYGVALSRKGRTTSLVTDPRSANVRVTDNYAENIAWEAYDTHGGQSITFANNIAVGCGSGVVMGPATSADDPTHAGTPVYSYAPIDCHATGNTIISGTLLGTAAHGISLVGAIGGFGTTSTSTPVEYASGCTIVGNTIRGHGTASNAQQGAIYMHNTLGAVIAGNTFCDSSPYGIMLYFDNRGVTISGNTFLDVWTNTNHVASAQCAAICSKDANNDGWLSGNVLRSTGARSGATYSNVVGVAAIGAGPGVALKSGGNDWAGAAAPLTANNAAWVVTEFTTLVSTTSGFRSGNGTVGAPAYSFTGDSDTGFYWLASGDFGVALNGALAVRFQPTTVTFAESYPLSFGTTTGSKIGNSTSQKLAFHGSTPSVQVAGTPAAATDLATVITLANFLRTALKATGGKGLISD